MRVDVRGIFHLHHFVKSCCVMIVVLISNFSMHSIFAKDGEPIAIIGGEGDVPYAAFLKRDGSFMTLHGLPPTGMIFRVAMNSSRKGLVGGTNGLNAYAAFVDPNGFLTPLKGLPTGNGFLDGVALHSSGYGLVGGTHEGSPFAAFAAPDGTLTYISDLPTNGAITTIAIPLPKEFIERLTIMFPFQVLDKKL